MVRTRFLDQNNSPPNPQKFKRNPTKNNNKNPTKNNTEKSAGGRPSKYKPEYVELAYNYTLLGAINKELAKFFDTNTQTINDWMERHPEFSDAIKRGKAIADSQVAKKLYTRAKGYEYEETTYETVSRKDKKDPPILKTKTTIKHMAPDVTACIFWLKNRRPDLWRDRRYTEIAGKDGGPIETSQKVDLSSLSDKELKTLERIIGKASSDK